jgi:hypothetical protein
LKRHLVRHCKGSIVGGNVIDDGENPVIGGENPVIGGENPVIDGENPVIDGENPVIDGENPIIDSAEEFKCPTCYKSFTTPRWLNKHKPNCKHISSPFECHKCHENFANDANLSRHKRTCKGPTTALVVKQPQPLVPGSINTQNIQTQNNIQNQVNNNNNNTQYNIVINSFGNESWNHITAEFKDDCLKAIDNGRGVKELIKKVHFDANIPENHNIKPYLLKQELLQVKGDERWMVRDKTDVLDEVIKTSCKKLAEHYVNSPIMQEDIVEHGRIMYQSLMAICDKNGIYYPLRKNVFAMMVDLWTSMLDAEQ